jgi:hypothetical protein
MTISIALLSSWARERNRVTASVGILGDSPIGYGPLLSGSVTMLLRHASVNLFRVEVSFGAASAVLAHPTSRLTRQRGSMFLATHVQTKSALLTCLSVLALVLGLLFLGSIVLWFYLLLSGADVA